MLWRIVEARKISLFIVVIVIVHWLCCCNSDEQEKTEDRSCHHGGESLVISDDDGSGEVLTPPTKFKRFLLEGERTQFLNWSVATVGVTSYFFSAKNLLRYHSLIMNLWL